MKTQNIDDYNIVQTAIAYLSKNGPDEIDLSAFSMALGMNERQLTAIFKRWCGLTPKSFIQAVALDHAKRLLADRASVLDTSYEIGLSSTSRLHDLFVTHQAMPPGVWAKRGEGLVMRWGFAPCPFGHAIMFATKYGIAGIGFVDEVGEQGEKSAYEDLANRWPAASFVRDDQYILPLSQHVFDPDMWQADCPIKVFLIGTDFEVRVWETLLKIPFGTASTYGQLAKDIGNSKASRAVGAAVGRNPVSFVVPCHRIVGGTGKLTGYHWGVMRKRAILGWETGQIERV